MPVNTKKGKYLDPVIKKLIDLFEAEGPKTLSGNYYYGDPLFVPENMLPAVFITKDSTIISDETNAEDEHIIKMVLNAVYPLKADFGKSSENIAGANKLYDILEGRDENTLSLKPESLANILRKHEELTSYASIDLGTNTEINYGYGIEKRGPGKLTIEGTIRFSIKFHQLRGN